MTVPEVAATAGVTRPIVYRHFENRQALILGVLEDFRDDLEIRFRAAFRGAPDELDLLIPIFIHSVCDTIEAKGPGAWYLLDSGGPDQEIRRLADSMRAQLISPWLPRVADLTGSSRVEAMAGAHMLVAASRALLSLWIDGTIDRERAITSLVRGTGALLREFSDD